MTTFQERFKGKTSVMPKDGLQTVISSANQPVVKNMQQQYHPSAPENIYNPTDPIVNSRNQKQNQNSNQYVPSFEQKKTMEPNPYVISNPYQSLDYNNSPQKLLQKQNTQPDNFNLQSQNALKQQPYGGQNQQIQNQQTLIVNNRTQNTFPTQQQSPQYMNNQTQQLLSQPPPYQINTNQIYNTQQNYNQEPQHYTNGNQKYQQSQNNYKEQRQQENQRQMIQDNQPQQNLRSYSARNGKSSKQQGKSKGQQHSVDGQNNYENMNIFSSNENSLNQRPLVATSYETSNSKYRPYTLREYEEMKRTANTKMGGLGPNTYSDDWCKGKGKQQKRQEFAEQVQQFNQANIANQPILVVKEQPKKDNTRQRAIDFSKQIAKPPPPPRRSSDKNLGPSPVQENNMEKFERQHIQYLQQLDQMK